MSLRAAQADFRQELAQWVYSLLGGTPCGLRRLSNFEKMSYAVYVTNKINRYPRVVENVDRTWWLCSCNLLATSMFCMVPRTVVLDVGKRAYEPQRKRKNRGMRQKEGWVRNTAV